MSFQDGMDALNLKMPNKIPRTEYSASRYWSLIKAVTGIDVAEDSYDFVKIEATKAFERAWDFGFNWMVLTQAEALNACRTKMGHANFAEMGVDFSGDVECPFTDVEQVLQFDPFEVYEIRDHKTLVQHYNWHYANRLQNHPDQVNMTGIYITLVSGLLEIFGWEYLLEGMGEDADAFGQVANRYTDWILQYFNALAESDSPVVMVHDDIVWTTGPFCNPDWYRKYVFPNYEKILDPLKKAGKKIIYTSDGNFTDFIDDIVACGVHGLVLEPTTDMEYIAEKYGQTHSFVGNADCRILTFGTKEDIKKEVERCINIGRDCPGFIMAVGNHIPSNVPIDNAIYYNDVYQELAIRR